MIEELIKRTNTTEFYQSGRLHLTDLKGQVGHFNTMEFNFILDEQDLYGKIINVEHWKLISHQTIDFNGIYADLYLPYIKLKILTDHPLLWTFTKPKLECELKNFPKNPSEFIGDLFFEYEKLTGNWIPVHKNFWSLNESYYKTKGKTNIGIQEPLKEPIERICKKHGIEFKVENVQDGRDKGYANRPNAKLLIFGNEDVSPNDFSLGQPYIIADEFIANRK
ncbi:hypothetical protein Celal_1707 [Cellulophaga algicola DSM 14237]|uniref:Uncharacterized protein n=1 Tax=Cellulophaga algicola (strain DSM 14237 / IC166 / ACAM 630) TaxID=688270 RepID=E6XCL9_CELAD|nr:hypothetical protein [Cellulophaga algicola]ADV49008.1 hypothetical protein Celal_1707 [Cellulophaga algicola DSM 14237]